MIASCAAQNENEREGVKGTSYFGSRLRLPSWEHFWKWKEAFMMHFSSNGIWSSKLAFKAKETEF